MESLPPSLVIYSILFHVHHLCNFDINLVVFINVANPHIADVTDCIEAYLRIPMECIAKGNLGPGTSLAHSFLLL